MVWFGPLKRIQKLFFRTPLVNLFVLGSEAYHDYYRWPLRDKRIFEAWTKKTAWGQHFQEYRRQGALGASRLAAAGSELTPAAPLLLQRPEPPSRREPGARRPAAALRRIELQLAEQPPLRRRQPQDRRRLAALHQHHAVANGRRPGAGRGPLTSQLATIIPRSRLDLDDQIPEPRGGSCRRCRCQHLVVQPCDRKPAGPRAATPPGNPAKSAALLKPRWHVTIERSRHCRVAH